MRGIYILNQRNLKGIYLGNHSYGEGRFEYAILEGWKGGRFAKSNNIQNELRPVMPSSALQGVQAMVLDLSTLGRLRLCQSSLARFMACYQTERFPF